MCRSHQESPDVFSTLHRQSTNCCCYIQVLSRRLTLCSHVDCLCELSSPTFLTIHDSSSNARNVGFLAPQREERNNYVILLNLGIAPSKNLLSHSTARSDLLEDHWCLLVVRISLSEVTGTLSSLGVAASA